MVKCHIGTTHILGQYAQNAKTQSYYVIMSDKKHTVLDVD